LGFLKRFGILFLGLLTRKQTHILSYVCFYQSANSVKYYSSHKLKPAAISYTKAKTMNKALIQEASSAPILPRNSHESILEDRDWESVSNFWRAAVQQRASLPEGWNWKGGIGPAAHESINEGDPRELRKTYFASIAYYGPNFYGFQHQKNQDVRTVAGTIRKGLEQITETGAPVFVAGRTDRGVSAIAQVCHFITWEQINDLQKVRDAIHSFSINGDINVINIQRVPRKWHANFSAKWRRYIYLMPLKPRGENKGNDGTNVFDIDVSMVNQMLQNLEGKTLSYFALAYGAMRQSQQGGTDLCLLHRCQASVIEILDVNDPTGLTKIPVMAVELIGNRFLQRMVRILVSTVVREVMVGNRNYQVLEEICLSKSRSRAAYPAPPDGLCMSGVGYFEYDEKAVNKLIQ